MLEQRARHGVDGQAEIASGKRVVAGLFDAGIEPGVEVHRAGRGQVLAKPRKQFFQGVLAACKQQMQMPALRDTLAPATLRTAARRALAR